MSHDVAIVIPAYSEFEHLPQTLASLDKSSLREEVSCGRLHVVVVVNQPINAPEKAEQNNKKTLAWLQEREDRFKFYLHIIDQTFEPLRNGVGEARKIGMDFAVKNLLPLGTDRVVSLDADTLVSENYVNVLQTKSLQGAAFVVDFEHDLESAQDPLAIALYELYLRYIRWQLSLAESPFAFCAIGSTMGTTAQAYRQSGGMAARPATEDFHFLTKLRKRGEIKFWPQARVYPSPRFSNRVFLGTGHFLTSFAHDPDTAFSKLMLPPPDAFVKLRSVLRSLWNQGDLSSLPEMEKRMLRLQKSTRSLDSYRKRLPEIFDGLDTWRYLRGQMESAPMPTMEAFLSWCRQRVEEKGEMDPISLLLKYRSLDRSASSLWPGQNKEDALRSYISPGSLS